jgi:hypothetical protein
MGVPRGGLYSVVFEIRGFSRWIPAGGAALAGVFSPRRGGGFSRFRGVRGAGGFARGAAVRRPGRWRGRLLARGEAGVLRAEGSGGAACGAVRVPARNSASRVSNSRRVERSQRMAGMASRARKPWERSAWMIRRMRVAKPWAGEGGCIGGGSVAGVTGDVKGKMTFCVAIFNISVWGGKRAAGLRASRPRDWNAARRRVRRMRLGIPAFWLKDIITYMLRTQPPGGGVPEPTPTNRAASEREASRDLHNPRKAMMVSHDGQGVARLWPLSIQRRRSLRRTMALEGVWLSWSIRTAGRTTNTTAENPR